jgi:hypothetical protein
MIRAVDSYDPKPVLFAITAQRCAARSIDQGEQRMLTKLTRRTNRRVHFALVAGAMSLIAASSAAHAQGLVKGVQQGAQAGNKAAGPVGGVLGGAIGGVVGVVTGVLAAPGNNPQAPAQPDAKQGTPAKGAKTAKGKAAPPAPQAAEPQLTAEQIVANSDAYIDRIKAELKLTPEQEKHWTAFNSAMHYLGHNGADRLNLRIARAQRDPPDDIIEQMRNEAQFLNDRAVDQRNVADAAEPLFASLDARQKAIFIDQMVRLSRERGLD